MDMSIPSHWELPGNGSDVMDVRTPGDCTIVLRDFLVDNYDRFFRRLVYYLGCSDQASDCLHDTWLRLGEMEMPVTINYPDAYVYRVACNLAMDRLRSNRAWQYSGDAETELELLIDPLPGPDVIAEARSDLAAVERAMQRLPHRHRSVLLELRVNEWTRQEVADRYGLSLRRVDTVLRQALEYCAEKTSHKVTPRPRGRRRAEFQQEQMRA